MGGTPLAGLIFSQRGKLGSTLGGVTTPAQFEAQGVVYTGNRPCFVWFRGDLYIIGSYTRPVVRHAAEAGAFRIAGIRPPQIQLSVVPWTDTGGSSGTCLAAITFVHKAAGQVLAESNFSNVVALTLAGQGRAWSSIDNATAEARVTHVRGYASMNGDDFRMAWEAPYGLTSYNENVRTAQLTFVGPQLYQNLIPPAAIFGHAWVGRVWYANTAQRPYRIWFSEVGNGQYVKNASFRDTLDREPITGVWKGRNELLVFCERASYLIRSASGQPGADDFVMEKLDSDVGCISHFGITEVHNKLWFPSEDGVWIYDGSFRYLMKEVQPLWRTDWEANKEAFRTVGFFMHDRQNKVYEYVTNRPDREQFENTLLYPGTIAYAGYYGAFEPSMAGEARHPEWTLDFKDRFDSAAFYNRDGELLIGSCDGKIRKQDASVGGDDGDLMGKPCIVRPGHWLFFEPGDEDEFSKQLLQLWAYVESELTAWTLYVRGGDEQAWKGVLPDNDFAFWKIDVAATQLAEARMIAPQRGVVPRTSKTWDLQYVPETVHAFTPTEQVTGQGFIMELRAREPIGFEYRGLGGLYGPGPSQRGVQYRTEYYVSLFEVSEDGGASWIILNPGDELVVVGVPQDLIFRVTLAYRFGAPAFPISIQVAGAGAFPISDTFVLAGPGLVGTTAALTLNLGTLTMAVAATDAKGIPSTPLLYTVTVTGEQDPSGPEGAFAEAPFADGPFSGGGTA